MNAGRGARRWRQKSSSGGRGVVARSIVMGVSCLLVVMQVGVITASAVEPPAPTQPVETVSPADTSMLATELPSSQVALDWSQPLGTVSETE